MEGGKLFRLDYNFPYMSDSLEDIVKSELPEFYKMCQGDEAERVLLHHAAFDEKEVCLLGTAVKYATGHAGKEVLVLCDK